MRAWYLALALARLIGFAGVPAHANDEYPILGLYDGQNPYLVVTESKEGSSKREPGIYAANEHGKWEPVILGRVLTRGACQGVIAQLATTREDRLFSSMAVVDGKIRLFNIYTRPNKPGSIVTLGEPEPLHDIHGQPVELPKIRSLEEVSVHAETGDSDTKQRLIVSVRSSRVRALGDGITFAFLAQAGASAEGASRFSNPPVVLDYRFQEPHQLGYLLHKDRSAVGVLSRLSLRSILSKYKKPVTYQFDTWKERLEEILHTLDAGSSPRGVLGPESVPFVDLETGAVELVTPPVERIKKGQNEVVQIYDPLAGKDQITLTQGTYDPDQHKPELIGKLDYSSSGREHVYPLAFHGGQNFLIYVNRTPYWMAPETRDQPHAHLKLDSAMSHVPQDIVVAYVSVGGGEEFLDHYVLVSSRDTVRDPKDRGKVHLYVIRQNGQSVSLLRSAEVHEGFIPAHELSARLVVLDEDAEVPRILFDHLTPVQNTAAAYNQLVRPTQPWLNLWYLANLNEHKVTFKQPLSELEIAKEYVTFREYEALDGVNDPTGIYLENPGNQSNGSGSSVISGQILQKPGQQTGRLAYKSVTVKKAPLTVSVAAIDAGFEAGKTAFQIVTTLSPGDSNAPFDPLVNRMGIRVPFSRLSFVQVVQGAKTHQNAVHVLIGIDAGEGNLKNGAVYCVSFSVDPRISSSGAFPTWTQPTSRTLQDAIRPQDVQKSLRYDKDGKLYWVNTPDLKDTENKFVVTQLGTDAKVQLHSPEGQRIRLLPEDVSATLLRENTGESDFESSEHFTSSWELFSAYSLDAKVAKIEKPEDVRAKIKNLFPGLEEELDRLANPQSPLEHTVFLVDSEFKEELVQQMVLHWKGELKSNSANKLNHFWKIDSRAAQFFWVTHTDTEQATILKSFETIRNHRPGVRPMLVADAAVIAQLSRPTLEDGRPQFVLKDETRPSGEQVPIPPHLAYLLETEGKPIGWKEFQNTPELPRSVSTTIIATPDEWKRIEMDLNAEPQLKVLKRFKRNTKYLSTTWKVWPPNTRKSTSEIMALRGAPVSKLERDVFAALTQALSDLADPERPAEHRILLIPEELKSLVRRLILSRWAAEGNSDDAWNFRNRNLDLYNFNADDHQQAYLLKQLEQIRGMVDKRPVLMANLTDIRRAGRLTASQNTPFLLTDAKAPDSVSLGESSGDVGTAHPHALYLLATEGRKIQPADLNSTPIKKRMGMLLIGTPEEWKTLQKDMALENRYDIASRFSPIELSTPSQDVRRGILSRVTQSSQIQSFGYRYDAGEAGLSQEQARDRLLSYLVNRADSQARHSSQEVTSAFIRLLDDFSRALVEEPHLLKGKVVDKAFADRLISKTFNLPLSLSTLPADDLLRILSREDAPLLLQNAGYKGPLELKQLVIETLLGQTRASSTGKPIPSSIILYGETSTGKTFLFDRLVKILNLKMYDFSNPNDETVGAIRINVGEIAPKDSKEGSGLMSVEEVVKHINHFLSLPNGYRGFILYDDVHKGDEHVISTLVKHQQMLFGESGSIRVTNLKGKPRDVPTRNLAVFMTLNPTQDQERIKKFYKSGSDLEAVIAALSVGNHQVEGSFLKRYSLVLNVSKFPQGAKAPKLQEDLWLSSRLTFNTLNRVVLYSPKTVTGLVDKFPDTNARDFLPAASSQLVRMAESVNDGGHLYVVSPSLMPKRWGHSSTSTDWQASGSPNAAIEEYVSTEVAAMPVGKGYSGQLELLEVLIDSFRAQVYEGMVEAVHASPQFAGGPGESRMWLAPFQHALVAHLSGHRYMPLAALNLDASDFGVSAFERRDFYQFLSRGSGVLRSLFPIKFYNEIPVDPAQSGILRSGKHDRSRTQALTDASAKIQSILTEYLQYIMRVQNLDHLPTPEAWINGIEEKDNMEPSEIMGAKLAEAIVSLFGEMYNPSLIENIESDEYRKPTVYDNMRLFMIALDRAISRLAWGQVSQFMIKALNRAASSMDLGQYAGLQHYLFASKQSLMRPASHEMIFQIANNSKYFKEWDQAARERHALGFSAGCTEMLMQSRKKGAK